MSEWVSGCIGELMIPKNDKSKQVKSTEYSPVGSYPIVDQSDSFICGYHDDENKLIKANLPLTVFGDHTRRTKFLSFPFIAGADGTQLLKAKDSIDDRLFFYLVSWAAEKIGNYGYDRHFKHLKEFHCDYPESIAEQSKIAEILSTVDRAIEQAEALIAKQQRIKTGLMQDLLTRGIDEHGNIRSEKTHQFKDSPLGRIPVEWTLSQIGNAATLQRGHDITENELLDGPYPVISSSGVIGYHVECTSKGPNVVVGRKGTIGNVHYIQHDFWAHDTSLYVTNFYGNNEKYFFYLFIYFDLARFGTKSGSPSLNRNDIHPIWIGLPSPKEQSQIANILTECDHQIYLFSSNLAKLKHLKTALMQDLLTGKKRVVPLLVNMTTAK